MLVTAAVTASSYHGLVLPPAPRDGDQNRHEGPKSGAHPCGPRLANLSFEHLFNNTDLRVGGGLC